MMIGNASSRLRSGSSRKFAQDFLRDNGGSPAVEFAVVSPVLMAMLLGIADFGMGYWDHMQVEAAAQAGAAYVVNSGFNATNIENAVASGGPITIQASPAPTEICGCPNTTGGVTATADTAPTCTTKCADGSSAGVYAKINARYSFTPMYPWPGLPDPLALTSTTIIRIK